MPERVTPADPGLLSSLADQISLPGYGVRNLLRGDIEAAGRNVADFGLNIIDSILPGDWIPEISGENDRPDFEDVAGTSDGTFLGDAVNFLGNVATDPITYIPGAQIAKAGAAIGKGVSKVTPQAVKDAVVPVASKVGKKIRRTFGAEKIGKPLKDVITRAQGAKELAGRSSGEAIVEGLKGSTQRELEAARDVLTNVTRDKATKAARVIDETETLSVQDRLMKYVMENPDVDPDRLTKIVNASTAIGEAQWASGKASGPGGNIFTDMAGQPDTDVVMGALPGTTGSKGIQSYFPHIFKDDAVEDLADRFSAAPSAVNERKLTTAKALAEYLNANPEITLADAGEAMAKRGAAQGELAARGAAGKGLMEMARAQGMELPDELLAKALTAQRAAMPAKAVVTEGGGDVLRMLGGSSTPRGQLDIYGIGSQSGRAKPPPSTVALISDAPQPLRSTPSKTAAVDQSGQPLVLLHGTDNLDVKFDKDIPTFFTTADDKVFASGRNDIRPHVVKANVFIESPLTPDVAKARLPEIAAAFEKFGVPAGNKKEILRGIANDNPEAWYYVPEEAKKAYQSLGYDGINVNKNLTSGQWWIPFSGKQVRRLDETSSPSATADPYGLGSFSGKSKPPVTGAIDEAAPDPYGIGAQSGKSAVGKSTAPTPSGLSDADRKSARDWLLSQEYKQADPLLKETALAIAKNLPGDEADVALHMLKGMEKRGGFASGLAKLNNRFKPVAVFGALVPKLGSITRNMTGGVWQKYSNPEARGTISPKNIPAFLRDWWASMEDGVERLFGKRLFTKNEFAQIDEAYKASGGDPRKALALIKDPDMRSAVERGVFGNNFVDTENLIAQTQRGGALKFAQQAWDYPAAMFKGAEQRMRYGLYKSLVKQGKSPDDAARIVRESLYDYSPSSMENRLARDVIPFFQFIAKSIPQQANLMAEKPWLASSIANLYAQGRDEPVMPMMEGKLNIPVGLDEEGNRQYWTNLGLPFESLSMIPNLSANLLQAGRDIEQSIVGSTTPLLRNTAAYTFGRDPTFGSMPGSYTKIAGQDLGELGGFLNQVAGTGLAPLTAAQQIASLAGRTSDDRTTLPEKLLQNLSGVRIQSVDPDRAIQQRLQALLERDPTIGQFRNFFSRGEGDVDANALLENLKQAQKSLKDKAKAQANVQ